MTRNYIYNENECSNNNINDEIYMIDDTIIDCGCMLG